MRLLHFPRLPHYGRRIADLEKRVTDLEAAVYEPEAFDGIYGIINSTMMERFYGSDKDRRRTKAERLTEQFDVAMKLLGVEIKRETTQEKFTARKVTKKAKR